VCIFNSESWIRSTQALYLQIQDAKAKRLLGQFLAGHQSLSQKYHQIKKTGVA
jgi:hypothetical protein